MDDDSVSLSSKRWASYGQYHPFIEHWLELERISRLYNFVCGLDARGETCPFYILRCLPPSFFIFW
jgi:hypothetical protein